MNIRPFVYLRVPDVALGGAWEQLSESSGIWGDLKFPDSAIQMRCTKSKGLLEVQETLDVRKTFTYEFRFDAKLILLNNTLLYFEGELTKRRQGKLEDFPDLQT